MFQTHLAADTIFMDWVIFWMFLTDFRRIEMAFSVAIPRFCWPRQTSVGTWARTGTTDLNIMRPPGSTDTEMHGRSVSGFTVITGYYTIPFSPLDSLTHSADGWTEDRKCYVRIFYH